MGKAGAGALGVLVLVLLFVSGTCSFLGVGWERIRLNFGSAN